MARITERDQDFFRVLKFGAMTIVELLHFLKQWHGYRELSLTALRQRVFHLIKGGYLRSRPYPGNSEREHFSLYALTDLAIPELVAIGIPRNEIRTGLPSVHTVTHYGHTVKVLWMTHLESRRLRYQYTYVDEDFLKSNKNRLNKFFPDLMIKFHRENTEAVFMVEVDRGTRADFKMADKISEMGNRKQIVIGLCENAERIEEMINALRKKPPVIMSKWAEEQIFFSLLDHVYHKGGFFSESTFYNIHGQEKTLNRFLFT